MTELPSDDATTLLQNVRAGDAEARRQLLTRLYEEFRSTAAGLLRGERSDHTLQPTALVHEAILRVFRPEVLADVQTLSHARAMAATAMRHILQDYGRARSRTKRGGDRERVPFDDFFAALAIDVDLILDLDEALTELEAIDKRQSDIVSLRFFSGMTMEELAVHFGLSVKTIESDYYFARAWLRKKLGAHRS